MLKDKAIKLLKDEIEELNAQAEQYSSAIDVRRITVGKTAEALAGVKVAIKAIDRANTTKRFINGIYKEMVDQHNQHLAVMARLKELLKDTRQKAFLKESLLKIVE